MNKGSHKQEDADKYDMLPVSKLSQSKLYKLSLAISSTLLSRLKELIPQNKSSGIERLSNRVL